MLRFNHISFFSLIIFITLNLVTLKLYAQEQHDKINAAEVIIEPKFSYTDDSSEAKFQFIFKGKSLEFELVENDILKKSVSSKSTMSEVAFYNGTVKGNGDTWARFMRLDGVVSGAFFFEGQLFFIKTLEDVRPALEVGSLIRQNLKQVDSSDTTVLINSNDVEHNGTCGIDDHQKSLNLGYQEFISDLKRTTSMATSREIRITLVSDTEYSNSSANASIEMVQELHLISGIFEEQLNINVILEGAIVLSENRTLVSTNAEQLLYAFKDTDIPNPGLRHLFTGKDLYGSTVGIAFVGSLCSDFSVGLTQKFGSITSLIFAHELGHNFGAPHDNEPNSACSDTPSDFLMNPTVGNSSQFSACSIEQILPVIERATIGSRACVTEITSLPPSITSTGASDAEVGILYMYDSDNVLNVEGDGPFTYSLDIAPSGMTLSEGGELFWVPTAENLGLNPVQITVSNQAGSDTQLFDVTVTSEFINFKDASISSYGVNQDGEGVVDVDSNPLSISLQGNLWKSIAFNYDVTLDTLLEFEFRSDVKGEIHGIGVDNNEAVNRNSIFNIHGTQSWLNMRYRSDGSGASQSFTIPIGLYYQGEMDRIVFAMDNDNNTEGANSIFSNVRLYERESSTNESDYIDFSSLEFKPFRDNQDGEGTSQLIESGKGIELIGNRWRKVSLADVTIGPDTVMEFEFKSETKGEIHGIGFVRNGKDSIDPRIFQLYGTQRWGNYDFKYTGTGNYQKFIIPVGSFYTSNNVELIFIMDHDVDNPTGESSFRNIVFKNE